MSVPYSRMTSELVYSGADRHSFGERRWTPVKTEPDRGPWPWDRTGGPQDVDTEQVRTGRPRGVPKGRSNAERGRQWVTSLEPGTEFRSLELFKGIGFAGRPGGSISLHVFRDLVTAGQVEKIGNGLWRRL